MSGEHQSASNASYGANSTMNLKHDLEYLSVGCKIFRVPSCFRNLYVLLLYCISYSLLKCKVGL